MEVETAVDTCPGRMDAADAEAPRIETAAEFCPRVAVESMETVEEAAVDSDFVLQTGGDGLGSGVGLGGDVGLGGGGGRAVRG